MNNFKENKKVILLFIPLILLFIILLGVTYAYYDINDTGETSSTMIIGGATISANYNISNAISIKNALPGDNPIAYKDISVTYNNTSNESYKIYLKAVIDYSTFTDTANDAVLYYNIYSGTNHDTLIKDKTIFPTLTYGKEVLYEIPIPANSKGTETYRINFYFPDSATKFQNKNGNLFLNGSIVLEETSSTTYIKSFANDSWEIIANTVENGDPTIYAVGSEKEVEINGTNFTVRVANNTTPEECNNENFSQTACGFVVEFVDIVEKKQLSNAQDTFGGWPVMDLRTYANGGFFNRLPSDLQNVIIDTKVISGHGPNDASNFTSTDKIYLLSGHEVYEDGTTNKISTFDSAYNNTRQLDYYKLKKVTGDSYSSAIKSFLGTNDAWWLRTPYSNNPQINFLIAKDGNTSRVPPVTTSVGFSPAFRIGKPTPSFSSNTWETIADNVQSGLGYLYKVGDEKEVKIAEKNYTVRVANNSTPSECNKEDFSETACGFVVEFVDIIENRTINSEETSEGGWPATEIRTYANGEFFNKLPSDLQNVIINTKVISSYGPDDNSNFTSTDKIYLLSAWEVWIDGTSNKINNDDTTHNNTRQLDYYASKGVTTSLNYAYAKKQLNNLDDSWWLRSAYADEYGVFLGVNKNGVYSLTFSTSSIGFVPAFRIG